MTPVCKHCKWLHDHWDIREIDYSHETKSCRRTMPPEVKLIAEAPLEEPWNEEDGLDYADEDGATEGQSPYKITFENNSLNFQKIEPPERCTATDRARDPENLKLPQIHPSLIPLTPILFQKQVLTC